MSNSNKLSDECGQDDCPNLSARENAERQLELAREQLRQVLMSSSWRVTRPLRQSKTYARLLASYARRFRSHAHRFGLAATVRRASTRCLETLGRDRSSTENQFDIQAQLPAMSRSRTAGSNPQAHEYPVTLMLVEHFEGGGLERVVLDLSLRLSRHGYHAVIACTGRTGAIAAEARDRGVLVLSLTKSQESLKQALDNLKPTVVMTHHSYFGFETINERGIPIIEVLHNAYKWQIGDRRIKNLRDAFVSEYVAVSEFVCNFATTHLGVEATTITTIENGLNIDGLFRVPLESLFARRLESVDHLRLIQVANFFEQKNHLQTVRALQRIRETVPGVELILVGSEGLNPEVSTKVRRTVSQLDLEDCVRFTGNLSRAELSLELGKAHVAMLPSAYEGYSIATLEYAFFGLPSVLSETGGAERLINAYGHGLLARDAAWTDAELVAGRRLGDLDETPSIADATIQLLKDYRHYARRGVEAGLDWEAYSVDASARRYAALISLVQGRASAGHSHAEIRS